MQSLDDLTAIELAVSGDASSEITLFGRDNAQRHARLITHLRADQRPTLATVLLPGDPFIDLAVVRDRFLGLTSYFIVKIHDDPGDRLREICDHYDRSWDRYIAETDGLQSVADFCDAIERLLAPPS